MGKPTPDETNSSASAAAAAPAPAPAAAAGADASPVVIRAKDGVWPDPPAGGRWSRNPKTGDLTCVEPAAAVPTPEQRHERRMKQRDAALAEANKTTKE
jgi:hypothetical protein